jgi:hypothetical protein
MARLTQRQEQSKLRIPKSVRLVRSVVAMYHAERKVHALRAQAQTMNLPIGVIPMQTVLRKKTLSVWG